MRGRGYNLQWSAVQLLAALFQSAVNTASGRDPGAEEHYKIINYLKEDTPTFLSASCTNSSSRFFCI